MVLGLFGKTEIDFFLTIISITLLFGDLVDHLEGTRNFDLSPSFHFMTKNG